jgi:hypothetical protein
LKTNREKAELNYKPLHFALNAFLHAKEIRGLKIIPDHDEDHGQGAVGRVINELPEY